MVRLLGSVYACSGNMVVYLIPSSTFSTPSAKWGTGQLWRISFKYLFRAFSSRKIQQCEKSASKVFSSVDPGLVEGEHVWSLSDRHGLAQNYASKQKNTEIENRRKLSRCEAKKCIPSAILSNTSSCQNTDPVLKWLNTFLQVGGV